MSKQDEVGNLCQGSSVKGRQRLRATLAVVYTVQPRHAHGLTVACWWTEAQSEQQ